jgi:hypothetical protein
MVVALPKPIGKIVSSHIFTANIFDKIEQHAFLNNAHHSNISKETIEGLSTEFKIKRK